MATLRTQIGSRILKRKRKSIERDVRVCNFETARSAVVLFDTSKPGSFPVIKDFRKFIEGHQIETRAFGYVPQKEIPQEMLFWKNYAFITRKDLNWYLMPTGEAANSFYQSEPDLLIDFSAGSCLELQFLVQLSRARFKVGCYTGEPNDYDLMIQLTHGEGIEFLAEQFKNYIAMLNPVNEPA